MASSVQYRRATVSLGSGVSSLYTMKGKCKPINRTASRGLADHNSTSVPNGEPLIKGVTRRDLSKRGSGEAWIRGTQAVQKKISAILAELPVRGRVSAAQAAWLKLHGYNPNLIVSLSSGERTFAKAEAKESEAKLKKRKVRR